MKPKLIKVTITTISYTLVTSNDDKEIAKHIHLKVATDLKLPDGFIQDDLNTKTEIQP